MIDLRRFNSVAALVATAFPLLVPSSSAQTSCVPAPAGMVSWWRAEENALDSVGGNNGTLTNNVGYGPGMVGTGFVFGGVGEAVLVGNSTNLQLQDFTIEGWIQRANTNVVSADSISGGNAMFFAFGVSGSGFGFGIRSDSQLFLTWIGVNEADSGVYVTDTNFHHVALTKYQTAVVFYLDGAPYPVGPYTGTFGFNSQAAIGAIGDTLANSFLGTIDEIAFYNRALSAGEIMAIYTAGSAGKCLAPAPPVIVVQPTNQTVNALQTATFNVEAIGQPPAHYQWAFNGTNIIGATNATLTISNAQEVEAGTYAVEVSNPIGMITSEPAILTIFGQQGTNWFLPSPDPRTFASMIRAGGCVKFLFDGTIGLTNTIVLSTNVVLDGTGHNVTISGGNEVQLFIVPSGVSFALTNVTLADGFTQITSTGAAILNEGSVQAIHCVFTNNTALLGFGEARGGAIVNFGTLTASNCTFSGNQAIAMTKVTDGSGPAYGGAIYSDSTMSLVNCSLSNNQAAAWGGFGGAIFNDANGTLSIGNSAFTSNSCSAAAYNTEEPASGADAAGGAIFNAGGIVNISATSFTSNSTLSAPANGNKYQHPVSCGTAGGGAIYVDGGTLTANGITVAYNSATGANAGYEDGFFGYTTISGGPSYGGALYADGGTAIISNATFLGNSTAAGTGYGLSGSSQGGCVFNGGTASFVECRFGGNSANGAPFMEVTGGAICNSGALQIQTCSFSSNTAIGASSQIQGSFYSGDGYGGAIYNAGISEIQNSIFSDNGAIGEHFSYAAYPTQQANGYGGGIANLTFASLSSITLSNDFTSGATNIGAEIYNSGELEIDTNGALAVSVTPNSLFSYQWQLNGTNVAGETNNSVNLTEAQFNEAATYSLIVSISNSVASNFDEVYSVAVPVAPTFTIQPLSQSLPLGTNVAMSALAVGFPLPSLQWYYDGSNAIAAATNTTLVLTNIQVSQSGSYTIVASNSQGSVSSQLAVLIVLGPPYIASEPQSLTLASGSSAYFAVAPLGPGLGYQWQMDGTNIGDTFPNLYIGNVSTNNSGSYTLIVSNAYGGVTSSVATLTVLVPPVISAQITNGRLSLSWIAFPNQAYHLQYQTNLAETNWINLEGTLTATNGALTVSDILDDSQRFYRIIVIP